MARNPSKASTTAKTPTHNLVVTLTTKKGKQVRLGYVGLFTDNNEYHHTISKMTDEQLAKLELAFTIENYGESSKEPVSIDDLI